MSAQLNEAGGPPADVHADAPHEATAVSDSQFWERLEAEPHAHDLFMLLRRLDASGRFPPLGRARRPTEEPLRLGQEPSMAFAPSNVVAAERDGGGPPRVSIYGFGLFGPNGALPLHLTEYARDRKRNHNDNTLSAFADLFHHRLILLFYRAWADAQSVNSLDRPDGRSFVDFVASLIHMGSPNLKRRDRLADHARNYMAGHLVRDTRNPEGLAQILRFYFKVPVRIHEFVPQWVMLDPPQISSLGLTGRNHRLGMGAMVGVAVRDAQSKIRIELGPLDTASYRQFLPGGQRLVELVDWVRQYVGLELAWDLRLVLRKADAQGVQLRPGERSGPRLGWGSWLGSRTQDGDADDMVFDPEAFLARQAQRMGGSSRGVDRTPHAARTSRARPADRAPRAAQPDPVSTESL